MIRQIQVALLLIGFVLGMGMGEDSLIFNTIGVLFIMSVAFTSPEFKQRIEK